jgi:hypothetical protein
MTFRELAIQQTFDFISNNRLYNSFFERCEKISTRKYRSIETGQEYQVGTVKVEVFHVE